MTRGRQNQVWVSPNNGNGWKVKSAGADKAYKVVATKAEAQEVAKQVAINKKAELVVQNLNGEIGIKNSYGNDYCPPKDKNN